ncbi:MAG: transposase [Mucilaginibacter sp.]|nr:transposase [Mucilaginibacter sp.]
MITFNYVILKHHKKEDGTWNVKIRVTYNRASKYLPTNMFVTKDDLNTKKDKIANKTKLKKLTDVIDEYRSIAENIGITSTLTTDRIIEFIKKALDKKEKAEVDFIAFANNIIAKRKKDAAPKEDKTAIGYQTVVNSLQDFFRTDRILITDITARSLKRYEEYLKTERKITRVNRFGNMEVHILKPVGNGINNYMRDIRALFNDAIEEFNDEDSNEVVITHYPFKKYKIPKVVPSEKRAISVEIIKQIRDFEPSGKADLLVLGRDMFMLCFYLVGINLIDLYSVGNLKKGRLIYNRSKTASRRDDKALISIKVEPEAMDLITNYADPAGSRVLNLYQQYATNNNFTKAVNKGLAQLSKELDLPKKVTSAYARTSWATTARNKCGISKDDVDLALNHVDPRHKLADVYIEKDFSMIDKANRKVLDTLR